mmetsp:Transcript_38229/g.75258  ORF Transcript_38229/g.75258 Transcript_38229/m.75258 type:complete len:325 (-) Transcript_38229:108-1082(-)
MGVVVAHCTDETLLHLAVDGSSGLRGFRPSTDRPRPNFIFSSSKKADQLQAFVAFLDDFGHHAGHFVFVRECFLSLRGLESSIFLLKCGGKRNNRVASTVCSYPRLDIFEPLVLLFLEVCLGDVDQKDDRFSGEKIHAADVWNFSIFPVPEPNFLPLLEVFHNFVKGGLLFGVFFRGLGTHLFGVSFGKLLSPFKIFGKQFTSYNFEISDRVDITLDVLNVLIDKSTSHVVDSIHCLNVGQECIPEALALSGTLDKTCNISDLEDCRDYTLGFPEFNKVVKSRVRVIDRGFCGIDCAERIVFRCDLETSKQVEQTALSDIRKTY